MNTNEELKTKMDSTDNPSTESDSDKDMMGKGIGNNDHSSDVDGKNRKQIISHTIRQWGISFPLLRLHWQSHRILQLRKAWLNTSSRMGFRYLSLSEYKQCYSA